MKPHVNELAVLDRADCPPRGRRADISRNIGKFCMIFSTSACRAVFHMFICTVTPRPGTTLSRYRSAAAIVSRICSQFAGNATAVVSCTTIANYHYLVGKLFFFIVLGLISNGRTSNFAAQNSIAIGGHDAHEPRGIRGLLPFVVCHVG